jgi:hypothetical protein
VIGLIGLTGFVLFLFKLFRRSNYSGFAIPSALSVFVVLFPVNTSMAFYGSYWSSIIWWLIMIFFLAVSPGRNPDGMKGKTVSRQAVPGNIT